MSDPNIRVPGNVLRFEIAAYLSLLLDTISAAVQSAAADDASQTGAVNIINALFILGFVFLVGTAARRRKNWARIVLLVALILAAISLTVTLSAEGAQFTTGFDVISAVLTGYALYMSFSGDARGWFNN